MAVIALATSGPAPSVVTSRDSFSRDGDAILIQNGDCEALASATECNASYDLHVGTAFRDHRNLDRQELGKSDRIRMLPGTSVIIQTQELVAFPKCRFGQILPEVTLLQKGIANTPSKMDPGYDGYLLITAFNHGQQEVSLQRGERFCSLHVVDVEAAIRPYDKSGKELSGVRRTAGHWDRLGDRVSANVPMVAAMQLIVGIASLGLAMAAILSR